MEVASQKEHRQEHDTNTQGGNERRRSLRVLSGRGSKAGQIRQARKPCSAMFIPSASRARPCAQARSFEKFMMVFFRLHPAFQTLPQAVPDCERFLLCHRGTT